MPTPGADGGLSIPHKYVGIREGQPAYACDGSGPAAVAQILVDWQYVERAEYEIIGYPLCIQGSGSGSGSGSGNSGIMQRWLPHNLPRKPWLWATNISECRGIGAPMGREDGPYIIGLNINKGSGTGNAKPTPSYAKALFTVEFNFLPYPVLADREITTEYDRFNELIEDTSTGEYVSPRGQQYVLRWAGGTEPGVQIPDNVGRIQPSKLITLRWHRLPLICLPDDTEVIGKTNSKELGNKKTNPHTFFKAGTLVYLGRRWRTIGSPFQGGFLATVEMQFRQFPNGANKYLHWPKDKSPAEYVQATTTGIDYPPGSLPNGTATYDEIDFINALWTMT